MRDVAPERLMPATVACEFQDIWQDSIIQEQETFDPIARSVVDAAWQVGRHWDFSAPAKILDREIIKHLSPVSKDDLQRLRRIFVARFCLSQVGEFRQRMPESILSLYPRFYARIAEYLKSSKDYTYDDYSKDVRYALNMTVPAGALEFDLESRVGPKLVLRNLKSMTGVPPAFSYLRHRSWGTWYSRHLDLRGDMDFTPDGWTAFCERTADALKLNKHIRGVQSVTWYNDPALAHISPRLAYIRETQVKNGAFLIRIGPGEEHTRKATQKSATRRRLVETGEYLPTCYALLWPRRSLLAWAEKVKRDPSFRFIGPAPKPDQG